MVAALLFAFSLALYTRTMAPGMLMDLGDPGDLQAAVAGLGVPHPTGYPLFVLMGWLWVHLLPLGTMAYRLNLLVAVFGALAVALVYLLALRLARSHLPAVASALFFGLGYTFWTQTSVSEVYTLNAVFVAAVLWLLVRWGQEQTAGEASHGSLSVAAFVYGLGLAHHRTVVLLLPALAVYVWLVDRRVYANRRLLARLLVVALIGPALYAFTFWRLLAQGVPASEVVWGTILGGSFVGSLGQTPDWQHILWTLPQTQFGALGVVVAVLGLLTLLARPATRAQGVLLLLAYAGVSAFCLIYRIPEIDPFLIPAFLCLAAAVAGLAFWLARLPARLRPAGELALAAAPLLLLGNLALVPGYWSDDKGVSEARARDVLSRPLETGAAIEADWNTGTALRYLQAAEGLRPDLEVLLVRLNSQTEYDRLGRILSAGRPVYLLPGVELSRVAAPARWERLDTLGGMIRLTTAPFTPSEHLVDATLALQGFRLDGDTLTLLWQARGQVPGDYAVALDYFDIAGGLLAQDDKDPTQEPLYGFRSSRWAPGQTVADLFRPVPTDTVYVRASLLAGTGHQGERFGQAVVFQVRPADLSGVGNLRSVSFGEEIVLAGYELTGTSPLMLTLYWQPLRAPGRDYTVFVHALDANGELVGQADRPPLDNLYPTSAWRPGDAIRDVYTITAQRPVKEIRLGLYERSTLQRLPRADGTDFVAVPVAASQRSAP
jgi:hypothetical protein